MTGAIRQDDMTREVRKTMATFNTVLAAGVMVIVGWSAAAAQGPTVDAEQMRMRQQMASFEGVLERAVSIGAQNVIAQLRAIIPERPRLDTPPRAAGFQLEGYGVVFHVAVPQFTMPILWDVLLREMQERQTAAFLQQWKAQTSGMPPGPDRDREMDRINQAEQQVRMGNFRAVQTARGSVTAASVVPTGLPGTVDQRVVDDPESAYTREVKAALIDAMLTSSLGLPVGPEEKLTVVARDGVPNNPQFPGDGLDSSMWVMSVKGSVLAAYRAGSLSKDEAAKQVEVKEQ
jgi:hypothetical protein